MENEKKSCWYVSECVCDMPKDKSKTVAHYLTAYIYTLLTSLHLFMIEFHMKKCSRLSVAFYMLYMVQIEGAYQVGEGP
jgi:hypothetical protein